MRVKTLLSICLQMTGPVTAKPFYEERLLRRKGLLLKGRRTLQDSHYTQRCLWPEEHLLSHLQLHALIHADQTLFLNVPTHLWHPHSLHERVEQRKGKPEPKLVSGRKAYASSSRLPTFKSCSGPEYNSVELDGGGEVIRPVHTHGQMHLSTQGLLVQGRQGKFTLPDWVTCAPEESIQPELQDCCMLFWNPQVSRWLFALLLGHQMTRWVWLWAGG